MSQVNEKRLTQRMISYWELIRRQNIMPQIEHFNSAAIEDLWHQCMMMSIDTRKGAIFKCEHMGDKLIRIYGRDMKGEVLEASNMSFPGISVYKSLQEMVGQNNPQQDGGFFLNGSGDMIKYRACYLPFGKEKQGITNVIVGMSFQAF